MSNIIRNDKNLVDLNLSFNINPNTGDINKSKGNVAIRRSIERLLKIGKLEKPFNERFGSDARLLLFEVVGPADIPPFESRIRNIIERNEPRVKLQSVKVRPNFAEHRVTITVAYTIRTTGERDEFSTMLMMSS